MNSNFYFAVGTDSHAVVGNNTEQLHFLPDYSISQKSTWQQIRYWPIFKQDNGIFPYPQRTFTLLYEANKAILPSLSSESQ